MKKFLVWSSIILFLLCVLIILTSPKDELKADTKEEVTTVKARIHFPEPIFDFGSVWQGENVTHNFKFQNVGDDTLKISKVRASCGCSKAEASTNKIPPGRFGEIEVAFKTGGYLGRQTKNISVYSNDPTNPVVKLQLKGEVKMEVEVRPSYLSFGSIPKHTQATGQFEVIQRGEQELIIERVTTNKESLKIDSVEKQERGGKNIYSVKVSFNGDAPVGNLLERVEITTNLERRKTILVPVRARILGDIQLSPERLMFKVPAGTKRIFPVIISTKGDNFEILKIENRVKHISTEIFTVEKFKKYRIDFEIASDTPPGTIDGTVKVYTNCPGETELTISIFGSVMDEAIEIGYFFERGCIDCERVHNNLQSLRAEFPAVIILKEYNIESRENMKLNETLCEIYNVPEEERMVTPAVFIGKDFLIGESITKEKLRELINKYKEGTSLPLGETTQMKETAEQSIADRFRSFGILTIIGAGLLDGINPCAFATMIFLISYLAIIKRKGKELIVVGIVFTAAIFITYFLIGIGIFEFLNHLAFLKIFTKILYAIIALFTFILGILSLGDYFKCRRGQAKKIRLQLPNFLKKRIHSTIRKQAGLERYVLAAFIIGFIVSILELSCTGQVYLPTIVYATGISKLRLSAYMYLLLYNFMFIVPLLVIFVLAYFGTTSVQLSDILGKNIALIKLLTSILFFVFTGFLVMMLIV
jgi:hypothetical protein